VEFELEVGCIGWVVLVEFAIGKGALLLLDEIVDEEVVFWVEDVVFWVDVVLLDELEETTVEEPVPVGPAVIVELSIVNGALLELESELVTGAEVCDPLAAVGPVEAVLLFPMVKRAELEELSKEEVIIPPVDMAVDEVSFPVGNGALLLLDSTVDDEVAFWVEGVEEEDRKELEVPVPVGPAEEVVLLLMVKRAELDGLRLEDAVLLSEVVVEDASETLEDSVPVGPAEVVVLFPIANRAELEELRLEEMVMVLLAILGTELEELKVEEVDMAGDAVGPAGEVVLPIGNGTVLPVPTAPAVEDALMLDPEAVLLLVGDIVEVSEEVLDVRLLGSLLEDVEAGEMLMMDDWAALDEDVNALDRVDDVLEDVPIPLDKDSRALIEDTVVLEEAIQGDESTEVEEAVIAAEADRSDEGTKEEVMSALAVLEDETLVMVLDADVMLPEELSVEEEFWVDWTEVGGSEEASDDWVEGMVADEVMGSAELEREKFMLVPADPEVLLAIVVEAEMPVELEADCRAEEDWTSRREVAIANTISLSACRLFWSIPLKYRQMDDSVLNDVATQKDDPAQVFKQVESVLAACLLVLILRRVPS
jgi:hypothetical protein